MKKTYQCKGCGGHLLFDPETQNLKCEYCKGEVEIFASKRGYNIKHKYTPTMKFVTSKDIGSVFQCLSCNTRVASANDQPITRCPSCGNKRLKSIQETQLHPMNIIPFNITKNKASSIYQKWLATRKFSPNNLKKMARLQKVSGLYAPIYLFDLDATTHYSAQGITERKTRDGDVRKSSTYINDTEHTEYLTYIRSANETMPSSVLRGMGGFDNAGIVPYSNEYLLGLSGLGTDLTVQQSYADAIERISSLEQDNIKRRLNLKYDDVDFFRASTKISNVDCGFLYVPVWANHYTYKGKDYHCYINGQTGKVHGSTPKSFWKIFGLVVGIIGALVLLSMIF